MNEPQVAIVVPTIREECAQEFLQAWDFQAPVYLIEDNPGRTFLLNHTGNGRVHHYCWESIEHMMGHDQWIIPRRSDCIRSFGFLKAVEDGADVIITLDDDCYPYGDATADSFVGYHLQRLNTTFEYWVSTIKHCGVPMKPRGLPYRNRGEQNVVINMGGWRGHPDLGSPQALAWDGERLPGYDMATWKPVPGGRFFPMCGMNLAFRVDVLPLMYFLLMGQDQVGHRFPYDRFGDIWCGLFAKRILDHWGDAVCAGWPRVHHAKASNPLANLQKEVRGIDVNERLWQWVRAWTPEGNTIAESYVSMAKWIAEWGTLPRENQKYWARLSAAMQHWAAWTSGVLAKRECRAE